MMEMLTNFDDKVDDTSDAGAEAKTWEAEAGYGRISVNYILGWVARNCQESCPGELKLNRQGGSDRRKCIFWLQKSKEVNLAYVRYRTDYSGYL